MSTRADVFLVEHGYAASRSEAQAAIRAGNVHADGRLIAKPSQALTEAMAILYSPAHPYVSRGALKLAGALSHFALSPRGCACLDIGASTGGFTEVLLEQGAAQVFAVDVGHSQLHRKLADDPRVTVLEGCDSRKLDLALLPSRVDAIVADVSFISLKLALGPVLAQIAHPAWLIALIKPQFEAGRERIGKGGIVKDPTVQDAVCADIAAWLENLPNWTVLGTMASPIDGGDGNREFLIAARHA